MLRPFWLFSWRLIGHRLAVGSAIAVYLGATLGLPLPALSVKDHSIPFPCMGHACGCRDAEQCWRYCCCFTPAERFAWAEANSILPPVYAERPSIEDSGELAATDNCQMDSDHDHAPHCAACRAKHEKAGPAKTSTHPRWIVGVAAMGCQGMSTTWISTGAVSRPPPIVTWNCFEPVVGRLLLPRQTSDILLFSPPVPPPRFELT
jgi:hypothetical protein